MSAGWVAVALVAAAVPGLVVLLARAHVMAGVAGALLLAAATLADVRALSAAVVLAVAAALTCGHVATLLAARALPVGTSAPVPAGGQDGERGLPVAVLLLVLFPAAATAAGVWFTAWHAGR